MSPPSAPSLPQALPGSICNHQSQRMREISQEPLWARPASARALPGYKDPLLKAPRSQRAFLPGTARSHLLPSSSLRFQSSALASRGNPLAAPAGGQATHRLLPRRPPIPTPYGPRIPTLVLIQGPLTALDLALHSSLTLTQANPLPQPQVMGPSSVLGASAQVPAASHLPDKHQVLQPVSGCH